MGNETVDVKAWIDGQPITRFLPHRRDWRGLLHYGVISFMLEKLGAVLGVSNLDIYAVLRGQIREEFLKIRNQQMVYSVAGKSVR